MPRYAQSISRLGPYRILRRIASGGMATVYEAAPAKGDATDRFAIKVIHPHLAEEALFRKRFLDEARFMSHVRHPNVVRTVETGFACGYHFIALELIDGVTARQLLVDRAGPLPALEAARIVTDAARGLHALHTAVDANGRTLEVLHRDLSPHNLMVDRFGRSVLIDLGLAKARAESGITRTGVLCGKLPYMSPEQAALSPVDRRTDVFSLGAVLFELCTGVPPFGEDHDAKTLDRVRGCDLVPVLASLRSHDVPEWLTRVVLLCLQKSPARRFPTALAVAEALEAGLGTGPELAVRRSLGARVERIADRLQEEVSDDGGARRAVPVRLGARRGGFGQAAGLVAMGAGVTLLGAAGLVIWHHHASGPGATPSLQAGAPVQAGSLAVPATPRAYSPGEPTPSGDLQASPSPIGPSANLASSRSLSPSAPDEVRGHGRARRRAPKTPQATDLKPNPYPGRR